MANTKTAKENILINERNRQRNVHYRTRMRTYIRRALEAIESKEESRESIVRDCLKIIDKTAAKGIIKKKTASRKKSRISLKLNQSLVTEKPAAKKEAAKPKAKKATATKAKPKATAKTATKAKPKAAPKAKAKVKAEDKSAAE